MGIGTYSSIIRNLADGAEPRPYKLPRKKVTFIKISVVPSIDGNCSKATGYKLDTPVSGGAYQDARKVTLVWNDAQNIGTCLKSEAGSTKRVPAPFSPLSFPAHGKR